MSLDRAPSPDDFLPLEPSAETVKAWFRDLGDRVAEHLESLPDQPAGYDGSQDLSPMLASLGRVIPDQADGASFSDLMTLIFEDVVPPSFNAAGPGYLGFIPGGGLVHGAIADALAAAVNRYVGVWQAAPGLAHLENLLGDWFRQLVGYPERACGILTSGGSLATLSAVVAAREDRLGSDFQGGVIYLSSEAHHCVAKAARIAGFSSSALRVIPSDDEFRIDLAALSETIKADRAAGLRPFLVVGNAGSTNTGAVDDLEALGRLATREELWFHVDAAYGGFFLLTEEGRRLLRGIERSDSVVLDPHTGLFSSYGTGALVVRDRETLRRVHGASSDYMPDFQSPDADPLRFDPCEFGPELSRNVRGLRIWLPLRLHGVAVFREQLEEKMALAKYACEKLRRHSSVEILAEARLSLFAFRYAPAAVDSPTDQNALNRDLLERIQKRQRVFLTGTMLGDRFAIRICVLSFRTHRDRVDEALNIIEEEIARS